MLDKPIVLVGRHQECDVQINSRKISRKHCCLAQVNDYVVVRDLFSTNGVRINGKRVEEGSLNDRRRAEHRPFSLPGRTRPKRNVAERPAAEADDQAVAYDQADADVGPGHRKAPGEDSRQLGEPSRVSGRVRSAGLAASKRAKSALRTRLAQYRSISCRSCCWEPWTPREANISLSATCCKRRRFRPW